MPQHPQRFWLAAILVAWAVDFLFWGKVIGISYPIFIILAVGAAFFLVFSESKRPARLTFWLAGFIIVMALVTILRSESFTRGLNGFLAFMGLGLLALTFLNGAWIRYSLIDYIAGWIELIIAGLSRAIGLPMFPKTEPGSRGKAVWQQSAPVVRGLLLAAPVVLIMGSLLVSADLIFAKQVKDLFSVFNLERLPEYLFRLIYILGLAYAFAGLYLFTALPKPILSARPAQPEKDPVQGEPSGGEGGETPVAQPAAAKAESRFRFLGATEAFIVLGSVNLLFAFFVAVQFRYFFGGTANIRVEGFTYSEYARRGFFELVWVAVLSLLLYLALSGITRREKPGQERTFTGLSVLLVGLVWIILISAFQRLLLYESAYGFTSLRTYTHLFIPWLGFLLLATIALQVIKRERYFGGLLLLITLGFALTLGVINVDGFISEKNIERARGGAELDGAYLLSLSDDAVPTWVTAYQRDASNSKIHETLGAVLACRDKQWRDNAKESQPWQSYHPASDFSHKILATVDLRAYPASGHFGGESPYITLNNGEKFSCTPQRYED